ncbi:ComF family protein [Asaia spathodeae]|uniref:ComF family protein n=1 Tax=Asaia spathodeae TaxID=657016 RepID=UPI002FC3AEDE
MRGLRALGRAGLDLFFPPICLSCGGETTQSGLVCLDCFQHLHPVVLSCRHCALPVASEAYLNTSGHCAKCAPPSGYWNEAQAAWLYEDTARRLILHFKYGDRLESAAFLAQGMMASAGRMLAHADYLVPVPLHRHRFWHRRYNQAVLLARHIARLQPGLRVLPDALIRHRATQNLASLFHDQRAQVLENAFSVAASKRDLLVGRHIVLIDDILTTGATASICARHLRQAGAKRVDLLVAARTVKLADDSDRLHA